MESLNGPQIPPADVAVPQGGEDHRLALQAAAEERFDEAVARCREAAARYPEAAWPFEMLGYLLQRQGETKNAIEVLRRATAAEAPKAALLHALGRLYYRTGAFGEAILVFDRALQREPKRSESHYLKGLAEFHAGRTRQAIDSFSRAAELDPSNIIVKYHMAVAQARIGKLRDSIESLQSVIRAGSADSAAHYHLGMAYYALDDMSQAARHFVRSIEIDPSDDKGQRMFDLIGRRLVDRRPPRRQGRLRGLFRRLRSSLVARITVVAVLIFFFSSGGLIAWLIRSADLDDRALARSKAEAISDTIRRTFQSAMRLDPSAFQIVVEDLGQDRDILSIRVMSKEGLVLASTKRGEVGTTVPRTARACRSCHSANIPPRTEWTEFREFRSAVGSGLELLRPLFANPADVGDGGPGQVLGMLQLATSLSDFESRQSSRLSRSLVVGGMSCAIIVMLIAAIVWWMVRRPLAALQLAVGRVGAGELDIEIPTGRTDEVGRLNDAFNRMTRDLRRSRHELDETNHSLEERVFQATEKLRNANQELERANARLTEFDHVKSAYVQKVVHDLRAPLSSMLLMLRNVSGGLVGPLNSQQEEILNRANSRAETMAQMIADLLDLEQLKTRTAHPVRERVSLKDSVLKAIETAAVQAHRTHISIEPTGLDELLLILGDQAAIDSLVGNLVFNAVSYTGPGGLVSICGQRLGNEAVLEITDTGIGIPAAELPLVFEEFFRASNARAVKDDGSGLGLAIVKRIAEAHGGRILLKSVEGQGTTVTVYLPALAESVS